MKSDGLNWEDWRARLSFDSSLCFFHTCAEDTGQRLISRGARECEHRPFFSFIPVTSVCQGCSKGELQPHYTVWEADAWQETRGPLISLENICSFSTRGTQGPRAKVRTELWIIRSSGLVSSSKDKQAMWPISCNCWGKTRAPFCGESDLHFDKDMMKTPWPGGGLKHKYSSLSQIGKLIFADSN